MKSGITVVEQTKKLTKRIMKLRHLLKNIRVKDIKGSKDLLITGVCSNSKLVAPGNLFIARKGRADDGSAYIPEAIASGAVAVVTDIYDPLVSKAVTQVILEDVASVEGLLAAQYYERPSDGMFMVGITGTNGKTTTSFMIKHLLHGPSTPCGLIGTIEYIIGNTRYKATRTTPDVSSTHKLLKEMVLQGCTSAVMEVTSHALDQGRVDQVDFDVAIFSNLTLDHLDYHKTMEEYAKAKQKLFLSLDPKKKKNAHSYPKTAIMNSDASWQKMMTEGCKAQIMTYGLVGDADVKAVDIDLSPSGTQFSIVHRGEIVSVSSPLVGRYNVYNYLAAASVGLVRKIPLQEIVEKLKSVPPPPGRLEIVENPLDLKIYVDFAHSDDALMSVLDCLQEFKKGKIIAVFGCGGNRDATKRPKMAKVCESLADVVIVTSDNPRNEAPEAIIGDIRKGFVNPDRHIYEIDRKAAIRRAIELANKEDMILIAGKGHETYQIFGHKTIEFDDRKVALELCQQKALEAGALHASIL